MTVTYVLMAWMVSVQSWAMLPIEGNPYDTFEKCRLVRNIIIKRKITKIGEYTFHQVKCVKREVKQ